MQLNKWFLSLYFIFLGVPLFCQYPSNLNQDIPPSDGFLSVTAIANTYNNARRQEEIQLNLIPNSIQDLFLPPQSEWDNMSRQEQALYLMNDERTARAGIDYGSGPVKGLAFQGIGEGIDIVSQAWAQYLYDNEVFAHCHPTTASCPFQRIDNELGGSCTDFIPVAENLAFAGHFNPSHGFSNFIAETIYTFNYADAQSNWGHRVMNLYQNLNNNSGDGDKEGVIGVGIVIGPLFGATSGILLCVNVFDASASCDEVIVLDSDDLYSPCDLQETEVSGSISSGVFSDGIIYADAVIQPSASVDFIASNCVSLNAGFEVKNNATFEALIQSCD